MRAAAPRRGINSSAFASDAGVPEAALTCGEGAGNGAVPDATPAAFPVCSKNFFQSTSIDEGSR